MRSARLPFKQNEDDPAWSTAMVYLPDTFIDRLRLMFGRYKTALGCMFGRVWYDPETVELDDLKPVQRGPEGEG